MSSKEPLLNIGGAIRFFLEEKGMSQGDVMRATGMERAYISKLINNGIAYPRKDTIEKIAKALGVSTEEIIHKACHLICEEK